MYRIFWNKESAGKLLIAGARKAINSGKRAGYYLVMEMNYARYDRRSHHIISNASCTKARMMPDQNPHAVQDAFGIMNLHLTLDRLNGKYTLYEQSHFI